MNFVNVCFRITLDGLKVNRHGLIVIKVNLTIFLFHGVLRMEGFVLCSDAQYNEKRRLDLPAAGGNVQSQEQQHCGREERQNRFISQVN